MVEGEGELSRATTGELGEAKISYVELVEECGRYTTFTDIPSVHWQVRTVISHSPLLDECTYTTTDIYGQRNIHKSDFVFHGILSIERICSKKYRW